MSIKNSTFVKAPPKMWFLKINNFIYPYYKSFFFAFFQHITTNVWTALDFISIFIIGFLISAWISLNKNEDLISFISNIDYNIKSSIENDTLNKVNLIIERISTEYMQYCNLAAFFSLIQFLKFIK